MKNTFRAFLGVFIALFLASTVGVTPVFAQNFNLDSVSFLIRNGSASIQGTQILQTSGTSISITPDSGTTSPVTVDARSVISVLRDIASNNSSFALSHIGFFDFGTPYSGGLYIKCATLSGAAVNPSCDNWQYLVNGSAPSVGVGLTTVADGDSIQLYFGPSRRITPSSATVTVGTPFTVTAETYVASSDSWTPATGLTLRILQGDPFNNPTIISSASVGQDGKATFTINAAGSYTTGLSEDGYYPNATITASDASQSADAPVGGGMLARPDFDIPLAISYVVGHQHADGSFDSALLSDWAAIAFAGGGAGDARGKLRSLFASTSPALSSVTDYERHAMALEALGINPYSASGVDYISRIVGAYDKTQVGDPALVNDDIFALIPLMHAGYGANDEIIRNVTAFIISKQSSNGSWDGSVDMTAAAIQALAPLNSLPRVSAAISSAKDYLHGKQQLDGGFGPGKSDGFGTSWVLQAIYAMGDSLSDWTRNTFSPVDYLASIQDRDGGVPKNDSAASTRTWATMYAIPAVERKDWNSLLSSFDRPVAPQEPVQATTTTSATTTPAPAPEIPSTPRTSDTPIARHAAQRVTENANDAPASTTTVPAAPPLNQTAAAGFANDGSSPLWKWALAVLLSAALAFTAGLRFHQRRPLQK